MPGTGIRSASYLIPRTAALLIILAQIPAASADLSDPLFFFTAVSAALLIAVLLFYKRAGTAETLIIIGLVPWAARFLVAAPRWFAPRLAWVTLDSLLLNLDRNNFTALLPFYWTAASSWFCLKHKNFLKYDILIVDLFFLVFLCAAPAVMAPAAITPSVSMSAAFLDFYRWPVLMIGLFGLAFFLQILSLIFSAPPEFTIGKTEKIAASAAALILVIIGCLFFIRPSQEKAAEKGGGLLEPNLFRFDFSQFLRLDPQISMNDDLILIVKKDTLDDHTLLRRFTLSGYSPEQGFYRKETVDEKAHPQKLPRVRTILPQRDDINDYNEIEQEYFLVNFDPSAFIGMNMPVEVTPYQIWDTASFGSAYKVSSRVSEAGASELFDAAGSVQSPDALGLSEEDYRFYTDYGGDQDYAALAREITKDSSGNYWLETEEIFEYLKYGDFRYSLKPGIAPDGNQLKYFLLNTKKGYCSYYAFAFALMLRSLGIPCRVAAGFFIDNETEVFNYYPVRANMAHAWVEVWFPRYGWIEYDPTSNEMAQGEDFIFGNGKPEQFENLLKEILDNRSALKVMEGYAENAQDSKAGLGQNTVLFLKSRGPCLFIILFIGILLFYRCLYLWLGLSAMIVNNPAAGARYLMAHSKRRLRLAGFKKGRGLADAEWAALPVIDGFYDLYKDCAAARFAPAYSRQDFLKMKTDYRCFDTAMRRKIPLPRRLVSWIFPLALLLPEPRQNGRQPEAGMFKLLLIIFMVFIISPGRAQDRQPQDLLLEADRAREAENWDRAAELYTLGTKLFPDVLDFPLSLGDIFYNRKLYHLAWNEYRLCEKISPNDTDILFQLARTAGYLNMNEESARYLEKVVAVIPDNREAIGSLGWIYFKIHRLSDGERLLLSAIDRIGPDPDFSMTLGTIYTDLFDYQKAKKWYLDAVSSAEGTAIAEGPAAAEGSAGSAGNGAAGDRVFAAVAHYNLSILESRFYEYDNAYDQANLSLNAFNRASGRLARGELYLRRMELPRTLAEYQAAYGMDTSPLSKLNLAEVLMIGGRLDEARLYAQDCLSGSDLSWMANFGIDPAQYKMEIYGLLEKIFKGLGNSENFNAPPGLKDRLLRPVRQLGYRFRAEVCGHLYRKYCLLTALSYGNTAPSNTHQDALVQLYNAFEPYPGRALDYLREARNFEEPLIPRSVPSWDLEEGVTAKNRNLVIRALQNFDPFWERSQIEKAYTELARKGPLSRQPLSRQAAEDLYAINPGALQQNKIIPEFSLSTAGFTPKTVNILRGAVKDAGIKINDKESCRYTLTLSVYNNTDVLCELFDYNQSIIKQVIKNLPVNSADAAAFSRALRDAIFNGFRP